MQEIVRAYQIENLLLILKLALIHANFYHKIHGWNY
jgi:hypothetical protein